MADFDEVPLLLLTPPESLDDPSSPGASGETVLRPGDGDRDSAGLVGGSLNGDSADGEGADDEGADGEGADGGRRLVPQEVSSESSARWSATVKERG